MRAPAITLGVGCAGVPGLRDGARLGGEDCGVGGGRPRREEIEQKHSRPRCKPGAGFY